MIKTSSAIRRSGRFVSVLAVVAVLGTVMASGASASPFSTTATALAVGLTPSGGSHVDSGLQTASNDGSTAVVTVGNAPALSVLGSQTVLSSAFLGQAAQAQNDGTAQACAGISGSGGDGTDLTNCAHSGENFFTINLGANATITGSKIQGVCASSVGVAPPTASASFVNVKITVGADSFNLPDNPASNTDLAGLIPAGTLHDAVVAIGSFTLNGQTSDSDSIQETALSLSSNGGPNLVIGSVTCGPAVDIEATPMIAGMNTAGIALVAIAIMLVGFAVYRRRANAHS